MRLLYRRSSVHQIIGFISSAGCFSDPRPTTFTWASIKATYTTKAPSPFQLDFSVPRLRLRPYNNGLGFHLGFRQNAYTITPPGSIPNSFLVKSESCIDVIGDMYCFLVVDDFNTVSQQTMENSFECLAKVVIREEKGNAIYDDGSTFLTNDVIFPSPVDLKTLRIIEGNLPETVKEMVLAWMRTHQRELLGGYWRAA